MHTNLRSAKTQIIINRSPQGYIRYKRGLRQIDPLSPLLFALAADVLSVMFTHALTSKVLLGIQLNHSYSIFHHQYADDLIFSLGGD